MSRSQPHKHDEDHRTGCLPGHCDWYHADPVGNILGHCYRSCYHFLVISHDEKELRYCEDHGKQIADQMGKILWRGEEPVYAPVDEPPECGEYVYFMRRSSDGMIKIGRSRNPAKRMKDLRIGAGQIEIVHTEWGGPKREYNLHQRFANDRFEGEWFVESQDINDYLTGEGAVRFVALPAWMTRTKR